MKVLVSFVGNTDPWKGDFKSLEGMSEKCPSGCSGEGAVLSLCDYLVPDKIFLFPSCKEKNPDPSKNTEWRAEFIQKKLSARYPNVECKIMPLDVKDATDFEELSKAFDHNIESVAKELGVEADTAEFYLNCTSGTQQMTALGYVFANTGRFSNCKPLQCKDPGKLADGEARIREINATFLIVNEYIKKIRDASKNMFFVPASENARNISTISSIDRQRGAAKFVSKIFNVYNYMDMLRYNTAYSTMNEIKNTPSYAKILKGFDETHRKIFNEQFVMIEKLNNGPQRELQYGSGKTSKKKSVRAETPENLTDLYFNMQRCFKRGAYADTLARFRRLCEGSVFYRIEHVHGINPMDLMHSPNRENLEMLAQSPERERFIVPTRLQVRHVPFSIGLDNGRYAILRVFDKEIFPQEFKDFFENDVRNMTTEGRDNTIVAHGMEPVDRELAEKCISAAYKVMLTLVPETQREISRYPFTEEKISIWLSIL